MNNNTSDRAVVIMVILKKVNNEVSDTGYPKKSEAFIRVLLCAVVWYPLARVGLHNMK